MLYVHLGDTASHVAIDQCNGTPSVIFQDVQDLFREKLPIPEWLTGVPTLVSVSTGEVLRGSHVVIFLHRKFSGPSPSNAISLATKRQAATNHHMKASVVKDNQDAPIDDDAHEGDLDGFEPLVDPNTEDDEPPATNGKVTMDEINQALASRGISQER